MPVPPRDLEQLFTVAKFEAGFHSWRTILGNISLVALASAAVMVIIAFAPVRAETPETFAASFLFLVFIIVPLASVIFTVNNVSSDFESRTGRIVFTNPIKRSVIAAGKFIASFFYVCFAIAVFYIGSAIATFYVFGVVPLGIIVSFIIALLYGCAVLGLAFLLCFLFRNSVMAGAALFSILFLCMPLLQVFLTDAGHMPWYLLTYAAGSISAFGGPAAPSPGIFFGGSYDPINPFISAAVMAAYSVIFIAFSILVFKRRDLT